MGDMGVAKRDQEGIIIGIVDTGSILVIVFQNKASDCFHYKPFMFFEDDLISHFLGQIEPYQQVNSLDRNGDQCPFLISSESSSSRIEITQHDRH